MSDLRALKEDIISYLKGSMSEHSTVLTLEFPEKMKPLPLSNPRVSIGFESLSAGTNSLEDFLGEDKLSSRYGKQIDIVTRFQIAVPERFGGTHCHNIFEDITEALMINPNDFGVTKIWCEQILFDKNIGGFILNCYSKLSTLIYKTHDELSFDSFEVLHKKGV